MIIREHGRISEAGLGRLEDGIHEDGILEDGTFENGILEKGRQPPPLSLQLSLLLHQKDSATRKIAPFPQRKKDKDRREGKGRRC